MYQCISTVTLVGIEKYKIVCTFTPICELITNLDLITDFDFIAKFRRFP